MVVFQLHGQDRSGLALFYCRHLKRIPVRPVRIQPHDAVAHGDLQGRVGPVAVDQLRALGGDGDIVGGRAARFVLDDDDAPGLDVGGRERDGARGTGVGHADDGLACGGVAGRFARAVYRKRTLYIQRRSRRRRADPDVAGKPGVAGTTNKQITVDLELGTKSKL